MSESLRCYVVSIQPPGAVGEFVPIVRALEPDSAAEVVRVLLAQKDSTLTAIRITVEVRL
jgi:hypothetical protein